MATRYPLLEAYPDKDLYKFEERIKAAILGNDDETRRKLERLLEIVQSEGRRRIEERKLNTPKETR